MRRLPVWIALVLLTVLGQRAGAQDPAAGGDRSPRFLLAMADRGSLPVPVDVRRTASLSRRISLDLGNVPLKQALAEISREAGLPLVFSDDVLPAGARVRLRAEGITVAAALTDVLFDTGLDVVFNARGRAVLVRRSEIANWAQSGTITGRVTDARTQQGVSGVRVFLERTRWGTTTDGTGSYRLTEVAPGAYTLVARRIGYKPSTQAVTVEADREVAVNVVLEPAPSMLNEVVVTATGEQRLLELGHVVGRIHADSVVKEAPVSSLSELLTARVPGLQVFQGSGVVGGNVTLQIRGPNSLLLRNEPVVIIDGVRYTSTRERGTAHFEVGGLRLAAQVERGSPLNHLNVNDIESIEVVKGPSAATLYGTDAANGVLVITTKRGQAGPARWNFYGYGSRTTTPKRGLQDGYWGWGTVAGVPNNPTLSCTLARLASGFCTQQDSITVLPNPANDPAFSVLGAAPRYEYGLNVAGGVQDVRYYFSADVEDATGPIQMPPAMVTELLQQRGLRELPEEWRRPNAETQLNLRTNLTAALSRTADVYINAGYAHGTTRSLRGSGGYGAGLPTTTTPATWPYPSAITPEELLLETSNEATERVFGSGRGEWRPVAWLTLRATVGLDLNHSQRGTLSRRGDRPNDPSCSLGCVFDERLRQVTTSAELGATATARNGRLSWRTSAGGQYVRTLNDALGSQGTDLTPGGTSVVQAANRTTTQVYSEAITLGTYLEETVGLNDRLFLTGALRVDGASTFGQNYDAAFYPKVNASWLLSEEPFLPRLPGLDDLRLRYAFGASGRQPDPRWAGPQFRTARSVENGQPVTIVQVTSLGNPALRPERVREHEFGFDATALGGRLGLELTWLRRRTVDQIDLQTLAPGLLTNFFTNLGLTTQRGFETQLRARLVESRLVRWDVTLMHSSHTTLLEDIGGGGECLASTGSPVNPVQGCYREGYPLGAMFHQPVVGYTDTNGDGIIASSEVQRSDTLVYMGLSAPPRSQTLTSVLGLFEGRLRLSAILDRHTGFTQIVSGVGGVGCSSLCRAAVERSTPLETQAQNLDFFLFAPGDYTRLQEVSAAVDLPRRLTDALRVRSATLVLSARNLALWSDSSLPDPGAISRSGLGSLSNGIPLGRVWALRANVGF